MFYMFGPVWISVLIFELGLGYSGRVTWLSTADWGAWLRSGERRDCRRAWNDSRFTFGRQLTAPSQLSTEHVEGDSGWNVIGWDRCFSRTLLWVKPLAEG